MGVPETLSLPVGWGPGTPLPAVAEALAGCDPESALCVIEAMEQLKRWADGVTVAAARVFALRVTTAHIDDCARDRGGELSDRARLDAAREAQGAVADEIAIATGLGAGMAHDLVGIACAAPERTAVGMAAMLAGQTSLFRVATLWRECRDLPARTANEIAEKALAPIRDGVPLSQRLFRQRLNRQIARHQPSAQRREKAVAARDISCWHRGDGTTELTINGDSERANAAHIRICDIAKRLRDSGDPRTLAQLRSDVALDLLLSGELPHAGMPTSDEDRQPWWLALSGALPPAQVTVTVPLTSLIGVDDEPAEIATATGSEHVPAWLARDIAFAAGSTWRRLVTDPHTGHALAAPSGSYAPPPRMRAYVLARDHTCRAPGCVRPATGCDLDHSVPWPRGTTSEDNLSAKHRSHHNHKTRGLWSCEQRPDGSIDWTLTSGRTYTTRPHAYSAPAGEQIDGLHRLLDSGDPDAVAALHSVLDREHVQVCLAADAVRRPAEGRGTDAPDRLADLVPTIQAPELSAPADEDAPELAPGEPPF